MSDSANHSLHSILEAAYGVTPSTPAFDKFRCTGTTPALVRELSVSEELRQDRQVSDARPSTRQVGGDVSTELIYGAHDAYLEAVLGGSWASDILKVGSTRRSFSMLRYFSDMAATAKRYHLLTGVEINTLGLSLTPNGRVSATFGLIGQDLTPAVNPPTGITYNAASTNLSFDGWSGSVVVDGTPLGIATELTLNMENGLAARFVLGSDKTIRPSIGRFQVTGQMTVYFEDGDLFDLYVNNQEVDLSFSLVDPAGNDQTWTLPRIICSSAQTDTSGQGPITIPLQFQALYDETAGTTLSITRTPIA